MRAYSNQEQTIPVFQNHFHHIFPRAFLEALYQDPYLGISLLHKDLQDIKPSKKYAILVGNEGQGVRKELIDLSDHIVKIEMETFESLNVAIATSICMYTFKYAKR